MGWVGPRVRRPAIKASFVHVGSELLAFDAVKVSREEALPQMPRNATQDWLFLD